jgi:MFS transporter, FHS family, glucose/mannose:H+ symporter
MSQTIHRRRLLIASCAGMSAFGFSLVLLGTLFGFPEVRARLHVDVLKQGELSSLLIAGMFVSTTLAGPLIDRFGNKIVLAVSSFIVAAAFLAFASVHSFALAALVAIMLGIGGGGLNTSTNVLVSDIYPENRGSMLNVLAIFFGTGAVMVPLLAARISPNTAMFAAAGYAILCGIMFVAMTFPPAREAHSFALRQAVKVVGYPGVLLFASLLFFESANEQTMHTFASTWVGAAGASPRLATLALMGYMMAMAVGRIFAVRLLKTVPKQNLVMASAVLSVIGSTILFSSNSAQGIAAGVVVTGLGFSAIYPTVLAIAGDRYQKFAGTVFGTLFAIALIGSFIAPSVAGAVGQRANVHLGTAIPLFGTAMVALLTAVVCRSGHAAESVPGYVPVAEADD